MIGVDEAPLENFHSEDLSRHAELLLQLELHLDVVLHLWKMRYVVRRRHVSEGAGGARYEQAEVEPQSQPVVAKALTP